MQATFTRFGSRYWLVAMLLLVGPLTTSAQQAQQIDPPSRVAYISVQEGAGTLVTDSQGNWTPAVINMPVTIGTRLTSEAGSRTELQGGFAAIRLSGKANLEVIQLDDSDTRLALTEGTLSARLRDLEPGERFEIDTPNMALVANQPGEYRFDVDPRANTTRLSVHSGVATVYGDGGVAISVNAREQIVFMGRSLEAVSRGTVSFRDAFDQWVSSRDAQDERSASARYVSPATPGYQQLDQYGDWAQDATYGAVWYPRVTVTDWAPYRYGHWTWVDPWGWTWIDDAPWGFAPSHYGRWAQIGPRWAWVPGPRIRRPVYAPALVGFTGGSGTASWNVSVGTAWFPLAPGEYWEPHYRASQRYRHALNPWENARRPSRDGSYHFQRYPNAITAAPPNQFGAGEGRRPRFIPGTRVPSGEWAGTHVVPPPSRPGSDRGQHIGTQRPPPGERIERGPRPAQISEGQFPRRDPEAWQRQRELQQQLDQQRADQRERQQQFDREQQLRIDGDRQRQEAQQQQDQWRRQQQQQRQQWEQQRDQQRPPWERQQNQASERQQQRWQQQQDQQRPAWEREQRQQSEQQRQRWEQRQDQQRPPWERQMSQPPEQQRQRSELPREQPRPQQQYQGRQQDNQPRQREERGGEQRRTTPRQHEGFN